MLYLLLGNASRLLWQDESESLIYTNPPYEQSRMLFFCIFILYLFHHVFQVRVIATTETI